MYCLILYKSDGRDYNSELLTFGNLTQEELINIWAENIAFKAINRPWEDTYEAIVIYDSTIIYNGNDGFIPQGPFKKEEWQHKIYCAVNDKIEVLKIQYSENKKKKEEKEKEESKAKQEENERKEFERLKQKFDGNEKGKE